MDEQDDGSGRWSWLKIGGLLSGLAALITAIATMIVALDKVLGPSDGLRNDVPGQDPPGQNEPPFTTTVKEHSGPQPNPDQRLSPGDQAVGLWPKNGCPYRVTVAKSLGGSYRVVFDFGEEESLPANAVFPMATQPIEVGDHVFATGEELKGRWIPGTVIEIKEGEFHVVRDGQPTCEPSESHVWAEIEDMAIRR